MRTGTQSPWASGPGEILRHGLNLLDKDSDTNRRLAMISIDNAVELMVKTYLGLPRRVTGLAMSRKEFQELSESFPDLLDALEKYAADKIQGVDLGTIEWYHRLRNQLYHQGNGLTVERDKVEVYARLANILFKNLFGFDLVAASEAGADSLAEFMESWAVLENRLATTISTANASDKRRLRVPSMVDRASRDGVLTREQAATLGRLRAIRNDIVHGAADYRKALTPDVLRELRDIVTRIVEPPRKRAGGADPVR